MYTLLFFMRKHGFLICYITKRDLTYGLKSSDENYDLPTSLYLQRGGGLCEDGHHDADEAPAEDEAEPVVGGQPAARVEDHPLQMWGQFDELASHEECPDEFF
jgi:hypothetical protein